jgi:hypothetical protein
MAKKTSTVLGDVQKTQPSANASQAVSPLDRKAIIDTIEVERRQIFRARAIAQTAAKLLHELYLCERNEPDIGTVLDVVSDMLEVSVAGLDRMTLNL